MWLHILTNYCINIISVLNYTENFFWRSIISYLNHMYFSLLFITLYILIKYNYNFFLLLHIIFLTYKLYFLELINFSLLKDVFLINNTHKFFFELLIGLVSIHPIIFYWGLNLFILMYLIIYNKNTYSLFISTNNLLILIIALTLGGVWGWLNFSWGYIWVYDFIEYFLLWLIVLTIYRVHTKIYKTNLQNTTWLINLMLIYYITLRYGFLPTRHSFFNKISLNTIKQTAYYVFLFNISGLYVNFLLLSVFICVKLWSMLLLYILVFITLKSLHCKNSITQVSLYVLHLVVYLLIFIFIMHTPNYFFFIVNKNYYIKKNLIIHNLLMNNYKNLINIKLNIKNIIRVFKSNNFFSIHQIYIQIYNTIQIYIQTSPDIFYFFLIFIIICMCYYKKW